MRCLAAAAWKECKLRQRLPVGLMQAAAICLSCQMPPHQGLSFASCTLCTEAVPGASAAPHAAPGRLCSTHMSSSPPEF